MAATVHATHPYDSYTTTHAPSLADTLPTLDFKFADLRTTMSTFTRRFDLFIETGRRRVLDERNAFKMRVAETADQELTTLRHLESLKDTTTQHQATLEAQASESAEMASQIASLTQARDEHLVRVGGLRVQLAGLRSAIATRRAGLKSQQSYLTHQAGSNGPEIEFWESYLGLRIEGTGTEDRIRFVFEGLDARNHGREAWCVLDVGSDKGGRWDVVECRPRLEVEGVRAAVGCLREGNEDLRGFLKGMRTLFSVEMGS